MAEASSRNASCEASISSGVVLRMRGLLHGRAARPSGKGGAEDENPDIKKLYAEYLGQPGSEKAHHLLHTVYHENKRD